MTRSPGAIISKSAIAWPARRRRRFCNLLSSYCCLCRFMASQVNAAPAVHGDHLAGDIGRVIDQETRCARDVVWLANAFEQCRVDDALACQLVGPALVFRPQNHAGRYAVDAHLGS